MKQSPRWDRVFGSKVILGARSVTRGLLLRSYLTYRNDDEIIRELIEISSIE